MTEQVSLNKIHCKNVSKCQMYPQYNNNMIIKKKCLKMKCYNYQILALVSQKKDKWI
jgi:hypothetical protein